MSEEDWSENISQETRIFFNEKWKKVVKLLKSGIPEMKDSLICTICLTPANFKESKSLVRHPLLSVPICVACLDLWSNGDWLKSDQKFDICGWCAQDGTLLCCSNENCSYAFCSRCIKCAFGREKVTEIEALDDWKCFVCNPEDLKLLQLLYFSITKFWKESNGFYEKSLSDAQDLFTWANGEISKMKTNLQNFEPFLQDFVN